MSYGTCKDCGGETAYDEGHWDGEHITCYSCIESEGGKN